MWQHLEWKTRIKLRLQYGKTYAWARRSVLRFLNKMGYPYPIFLDFPLEAKPRYGWGKPPHPGLAALFDRRRGEFRNRLAAFLEFKDELLAIQRQCAGPQSVTPCWLNDSLPALDMVAIYGMLAQLDPKRYLEIGIGNSTKVARYAVETRKLRTRIIGIDPFAVNAREGVCDELLRERLEDMGLAFFDQLEPGDVLFIDNSHRVFMNSDVTVVFMDLLPRLKPGVVVHIHDITLPVDYPPTYVEHWYSEQYVLGAVLMLGEPRFEILLANAFCSFDQELAHVLDPLWAHEQFEGVAPHGSSIWLRMR